MKHAAAVAAMFALLAFPAIAQRGGARGGGGGHASAGFAGHSGGFSGHAGFSGGFSAPHFGNFASHSTGFAPRYGGFAPRYGSFSPRFGAYAPRGYAPRTRTSAGRMPYRANSYGRLGNRYAANGRSVYGGDHGRDPHHRRPYYNRFNGLPYAYNYGVWPSYGFENDPCSLEPDWLDSDNWDGQDYACGNVPAPYPDYGESGLAYGDTAPPYGEGPEYGEEQYGEPGPQSDQAQLVPEQYPAPQPDGESDQQQNEPAPWPRQSYTGGNDSATPQQAVTLILKNGHPPETIQNYILTANTLTVLDHRYRQIPVDQIDLPATEAANRANGINFHVPGAAKQ